jgi:regulator of ribosome biosynthesis
LQATPADALRRTQFAPNEIDTSSERNAQLAMLNGLGGSASRSKPNAKGQGDESLVNARKAVRFASGGRGSAALAGGARGGRGGRGGRGRGRGK